MIGQSDGTADAIVSEDLFRMAASLKDDFQCSSDPDEKREIAREIIQTLVMAAEGFAGSDVVQAALPKPTEGAPRPEHLAALSERLMLVLPLFQAIDGPKDQHSLWAAVGELGYITRGDVPRLFARTMKTGKFDNTIKLAEHWLRAWEWIEFLKRGADTKGECKDVVAKAYGIERDSLEKWRGQAREHLGREVDRRLRRAAEGKSPRFRFRTEDEGWAALKDDGDAYLIEKGYDGESVEKRVVDFPRGTAG